MLQLLCGVWVGRFNSIFAPLLVCCLQEDARADVSCKACASLCLLAVVSPGKSLCWCCCCLQQGCKQYGCKERNTAGQQHHVEGALNGSIRSRHTHRQLVHAVMLAGCSAGGPNSSCETRAWDLPEQRVQTTIMIMKISLRIYGRLRGLH